MYRVDDRNKLKDHNSILRGMPAMEVTGWPVYKFFFLPQRPFYRELRFHVPIRKEGPPVLERSWTRDEYMEALVEDGTGIRDSLSICDFVFGDSDSLPVKIPELEVQELKFIRTNFLIFDKVLFVEGNIRNADNFIKGFLGAQHGYRF